MTAKVEEVDIVVKSVLDKVVRLRSAHDERVKAINSLNDDLDEVNRERSAMLESVRAKMNELNPKHKSVKV